MAKILQLKRNATLYVGHDAALTALKNKLAGETYVGEALIARYKPTVDSNDERILFGLVGSNGKYEIFDNAAAESALDEAIKDLDAEITSDNGTNVQVKVTEVDGKITAVNIITDNTINSTDLSNVINGLDSTISTTEPDGDRYFVLTGITEEDGQLTNKTEVKLSAVAKTGNASDVATSDIAETSSRVAVTGENVPAQFESLATTLKTVQDNAAKYKSVALTSEEIAELPGAVNIKDAYKIVSYIGEESASTEYTQVGDTIKIYKDSSLKEVYLGAGTDTVNATTGAVTKYAYELISDPSTQITAAEYAELTEEQKALYQAIDSQSMNFVYQLADGTYSITKIDVSKFLTESEFSDGLQVSNAVVSVKKDDTSGKVRTAAQPAEGEDTGLVDVLTISSAGVKIANIQEAINYAISTLDTADAAVAGQYISQVVETDGKLTISRANVSDAILTGYAKGSKPVSTAVAATDDVKGAIAKLEHQIDDAEAAAKTVIDTTVTGESASHMTITKNTAADGHDAYAFELTDVASEDALEAEVTRAETAEGVLASSIGCGYSAGVATAYASTTGNTYATTDQVKSDIAALDTEVANALNGVTGSNAIGVTEKGNKNQTISLTLDEKTAESVDGNQYVSNTGSNALKITSNGLYLSNVWDCGTFGN